MQPFPPGTVFAELAPPFILGLLFWHSCVLTILFSFPFISRIFFAKSAQPWRPKVALWLGAFISVHGVYAIFRFSIFLKEIRAQVAASAGRIHTNYDNIGVIFWLFIIALPLIPITISLFRYFLWIQKCNSSTEP